jgi:hypothetical protein
MKTPVFKVELLIIDQNGQHGLDEMEVGALLESVRYLYPIVLSIQTVDIGEWDDDNPLNSTMDSLRGEVNRLFPKS